MMILKRADRLTQEISILSGRTISVDYLMNVFEVTRASILKDLKTLKKKGIVSFNFSVNNFFRFNYCSTSV